MKYILASIAAIALTFIVFAFILWSLNPPEWTRGSRMFLSFFSFGASVIACLIVFENKLSLKK
jgi:ABC-type uncharacterized transport system permease subunit